MSIPRVPSAVPSQPAHDVRATPMGAPLGRLLKRDDELELDRENHDPLASANLHDSPLLLAQASPGAATDAPTTSGTPAAPANDTATTPAPAAKAGNVPWAWYAGAALAVGATAVGGKPDDDAPPKVTVTDNTEGTASGPVTFTFTFSEPVTGLNPELITVVNGNKGAFTAVSSTVFTLVVTPLVNAAATIGATSSSGNISVSLPAGVAVDFGGNGSNASTAVVQSFVDTRPTLQITDDQVATATGDITYTFTFSERVSGFDASDVTVSAGTKGAFAGSGSVYTLIVSPPSNSTGEITVNVAASRATDSANNPNVASAPSVQLFDTTPPDLTAPTLTITDNAASVASGDFTYFFEFSEPVTGFTADQIALNNATKGTFSGSGASYTLVVSPNANSNGVVELSIAAGSARDAAGNSLATSVAAEAQVFDTRPLDLTAPTVVITDNEAGVALGDFTYFFEFSEEVSGFSANQITLTNASKGAFAGSGRNYSLVVSPAANAAGNIELSIAAGSVADLAGNPIARVDAVSQAFNTLPPDITAPTLAITDNAPETTTGDFTLYFDFSEPVSDFAADRITLTNGSKGAFGGSGSSYFLVVSPTANASGTVTATVAAGAARDAAGNLASGAATSQAFDTRLDTVAPVLNITDNVALTATGDVTFTFTFSEPVTGFTADQILVSGGSKGLFAGSGASYSLVVSPTANTQGTITVDVAALSGRDGSGNGNAAVQASQIFDTRIDSVAPVLDITDSVAGIANGDVTFTFTFSEPVTGFTADQIVVSNGTKGLFSGSGASYSLIVSPTANAQGTINVDVGALAAVDAAGNGNAAVQASQIFDTRSDTLAPTLVVTDDTVGTASGDVVFTFTFSEPVTGFTANQIAVSGGSKGLFSGSGASYSLAVSPSTNAQGTINVEVGAQAGVDGSGNGNAAVQASQIFDTRTDTVAPTLVVTDNTVGTASGDVVFTFTFSEPVTGFTANQIAVSGGSKGLFSGSGASYSLVVSPSTNAQGTITVDVGAQAGVDGSGNGNAAVQASQIFDTRADAVSPTVVVTDNTSGVATGDVTFTFTFSEPVIGFDATGVNVTGGTKGAFAGSGNVYTLIVSPLPNAAGTIAVDVPAGAASDAGGNLSGPAAQVTQAYDTRPDTTAPTVSITDNVAGTATGDVTFTFAFSESVTGFTAADIVVTNGTKGTFAGSGSGYTLVVTPTSNATGTITVDVAAAAASDAAGNASLVATQATQLFDTVPAGSAAPSLTITDNVSGVATGPVTFLFSFSESVTGFTADDISVINGTKGAFSGSGSTYSLIVTPPTETTAQIGVSVAPGAALDIDGNTNTLASGVQDFNTHSLTYTPGQEVIDLGQYGKLIAPTQVDGGQWFYYWDRSGDGTSANSGSINGGRDVFNHDELDALFNQDVNGFTGGAGNTDVSFRYATLNGVRVALPTVGELPLVTGFRPGTTVDNSPSGETNLSYNDLLAVWDANNGSGTGTLVNGTPAGWASDFYWSANLSASVGGHALVRLGYGGVYYGRDTYEFHAAVQVI